MDDNLEHRLHQLFSQVHENLPSDEFERNVRRRVARIRRTRSIAQIFALAALAVMAYVVTPLVGIAVDHVAESSALLTEGFGEIGATPVAFAVGIAAAFYALFELRRR